MSSFFGLILRAHHHFHIVNFDLIRRRHRRRREGKNSHTEHNAYEWLIDIVLSNKNIDCDLYRTDFFECNRNEFVEKKSHWNKIKTIDVFFSAFIFESNFRPIHSSSHVDCIYLPVCCVFSCTTLFERRKKKRYIFLFFLLKIDI